MKMQLKTGGKEEDKRNHKWQIDKGNKFTNNKNAIKTMMRNQEMWRGGLYFIIDAVMRKARSFTVRRVLKGNGQNHMIDHVILGI